MGTSCPSNNSEQCYGDMLVNNGAYITAGALSATAMAYTLYMMEPSKEHSATQTRYWNNAKGYAHEVFVGASGYRLVDYDYNSDLQKQKKDLQTQIDELNEKLNSIEDVSAPEDQ